MIDLNTPIVQALQQVTLMDIIKAYLIYLGIITVFFMGIGLFIWRRFK